MNTESKIVFGAVGLGLLLLVANIYLRAKVNDRLPACDGTKEIRACCRTILYFEKVKATGIFCPDGATYE